MEKNKGTRTVRRMMMREKGLRERNKGRGELEKRRTIPPGMEGFSSQSKLI